MKQRRKKSARKYTLYYLLALLLVLLVGATLSLTVLFGVERIAVEGETRYADGRLIEKTGILLGDNLLRLPVKRIAQALIDNFPYLLDVTIERRLPDSVTIRVTEARPVEALETPSGYVLIDERGRVLEDSLPARPEGWPRVVGVGVGEVRAGSYLPETALEAFRALRSLSELIDAEGLEGVDLIDASDPLSLRLLWEGRVAVELGSRLDLDYKLRFAKTALESLDDDRFIGALDVSVRRPTAYLTPRNIFSAEHWPFLPELLPDYERVAEVRPALPGIAPDAPAPSQEDLPEETADGQEAKE